MGNVYLGHFVTGERVLHTVARVVRLTAEGAKLLAFLENFLSRHDIEGEGDENAEPCQTLEIQDMAGLIEAEPHTTQDRIPMLFAKKV